MQKEERMEEKSQKGENKRQSDISTEYKNKVLTSRNIFNPRLSKKHFSKRHLLDKRVVMTATDKKGDSKSLVNSSLTVPVKSIRGEGGQEKDFQKKLVSNLIMIKNTKNMVKNKDDKKKYKLKEFEGQSARYSSK